MSDSSANESTPKLKKPKMRSPNYPLIGLKRAVELIDAVYREYGAHPVPLLLLHKLWKVAEGSNTGNQWVAALKAYGLATVSGIGDNRKAAVSKEGIRIVGNAPDRPALLKSAALRPSIHKEIVAHFGQAGVPADALLKQYLIWERPEGQRFNPAKVKNFIERFRETLAYSGALAGDIINSEGGEDDDEPDEDGEFHQEQPPPPPLKVGDFAQWTSMGADQFTPPKKVASVSDDGEWAFFDGSPTGVPMSELTLQDAPAPATSAASTGVKTPPANPNFRPPAASAPLTSNRTQPGISLIVGYSADGQPFYGHVSFDVPVQKGFLRRLGKQLRAMEAAAMSEDDDDDGK